MQRIPLSKGRFALIDDEDYEYLIQYRWHFHVDAYAARSIPGNHGTHFYMHNEIMGVNSQVDHRDRDGLNNQKLNLRIASKSLQGHNRLMPKRDLPRGVSEHKGKFQASVRFNRHLHYLGRYNTPEEAEAVYLKKSLEFQGELPPRHGD